MTDKKRIATTISVPELFRLFPNEDACYRWLEASRWNGKPVCPHCGGVKNIGPSPNKPLKFRGFIFTHASGSVPRHTVLGVGVSNEARARQRPRAMRALARADSRAA